MTSSATPKPLVSVRLDLPALWRNSPVAVFAVFMVGISNSAFGTLAAVYGDRIGLGIATIALFTSIPILAGAVAQIPVGILSDRVDRRYVLIGVALTALCADIAFILIRPEAVPVNLLLASVFGAAIYAMYPVIVAHANDSAAPGTYIQVSGGLLMVYGFGAIAGPTLAGVAMSGVGPAGLFAVTAGSHVLLIAQAIYRISRRAAPTQDAKTEFKASTLARSATPQTVALSASEEDLKDFAAAEARAQAEAQETP